MTQPAGPATPNSPSAPPGSAARHDLSTKAGIRACLEQALALHRQGRIGPAYELYKSIVAADPAQFDAFHMMGVVLNQANQNEHALPLFERALALKPTSPEAHYNRALALQSLGRLDAAIAGYRKALELKPDYASAATNLGNSLRNSNRLDEALAAYDLSLRLRPAHAGTEVNRALCLLKRGDYPEGFAQYEARWRDAISVRQAGLESRPGRLWLGREDLAGKTILLYAEQGLGDTLQFCRYAALVAARGARVWLEAHKRLLPLLQSLAGVERLIESGTTGPAADFHCPLMSLPLACGTTLANVPAAPAYLHADAARNAAWAARLGPRTGNRPRVGLVWSGGPDHKEDGNRSMRLDRLLPFLPDHCDYVSLQKDLRPDDAAVLAQRPDIRHYGPEQNDFADAAALCAQMDVVISVDTSVAHLAAATGRPTWVLLAFSPDWRWLLNRDDSVWYPTVRLFRQRALGDWSAPLAAVQAALAGLPARPAP